MHAIIAAALPVQRQLGSAVPVRFQSATLQQSLCVQPSSAQPPPPGALVLLAATVQRILNPTCHNDCNNNGTSHGKKPLPLTSTGRVSAVLYRTRYR